MKCSKKTIRLFSMLLILTMCFTLLQGMTAFAAVNSNAYFLTGTIASWGLNADYEMTEAATGLYKIEGVALTTSDLIKVVKSNANGTAIGSWYPDGMDNNQTVPEDGDYTVYFRPAGDGTAEEGYTYIPYEGDNSGLDAHGCTNGGYMFKFVKEEPVTAYSLWVGGVQVTDENAGNVLAGDAVNDGKVSYDADTKTLTLSGANIETGYQVGGQKAAIYTTDDLIVVGNGSMGGDDIGFGLYAKGEKSLTLNGDFSFAGTLNGIYTYGGNNMLVESGNVTAVGGTNGIFASLNSSITVNGGNVTATGHGATNAYGYGVQAETLTINGGSLMATGGTSGNPGNGLGVEALTVSGGSVTAVGNSGALYAAPTLGSNVTAVASANINGTGYVSYNASQNNSYKWFRTTEAYNLYVGGTQVTSLNSSNVLGDGKVSYDADTNTLTLDGANITNPYNPKGKQYYGIFAKDIADLHIVAEGDSVINIPHQESSNTVRALSIQNTSASKATITCNGNLTVKAETSGISISQTELTVNGSGTLAVESQYAVSGNNALNIDGNVTVNLTANTGAPAALLGEGGSFSVDVGENAALNINCTYWGTQRVTSISSKGTTSITSTGAYGIFGYDTQTAVSVTGGSFSVSGATKALRDASVTVNDGLAIYAGENGTSAVKQSGKTYSADAKYVSVKAPATYTVNITPGTNMTKTSGEELQTVGEGEAITDVVYTASSGCFPDTYSVETVNGITVTRNSATQITVSGTPTAAANITLTAPSEHQAGEATSENEVSATCTEQGSYDSVTYCKHCGTELSRTPTNTDPLGHNFGAPSYEWSADNKSVTGKRTCGRDASHIDTETVNTTSEITKPATLTEPGEHTYTATFTKTGFTTQTKTVADIPVLVSSFTVTFNANDGTVTPANDETGADGKLASLPTPTRSGYNFNGWFTAASGGTKVTTETVFDADTEIFAQWTKKSSGGGGGSSAPATYTVTPVKTENGSVTTSPKNAAKGSTVKITVTPDEGYKLDKLTVTDKNGNVIEVTEKDGIYTFTMPAGKVDVTPLFVKEDSEPTTIPADPATQPVDNENPFTDVKTGNYFYDAVLWAAKENITSGTTDTTFSPNESCTRAQTVTFLWRAEGSPEPKTTINPFTDVKEGDYFYKAVLWAYENGITKGTSDTEFSPNATVTRGQTVTFLYRMNGEKTNGENPFADVKAEDYYYDSVLWAYENKITSGTSDTTFSPDDDCLRGQIVAFLYRCKNK
ncbi:MAG: hypothetical protein E7389_06630 [Ruminococcaceae bacterium]|nr:hypothetical protein [Oscillospiraceae bacterium]